VHAVDWQTELEGETVNKRKKKALKKPRAEREPTPEELDDDEWE
jgi:hypothetical protein